MLKFATSFSPHPSANHPSTNRSAPFFDSRDNAMSMTSSSTDCDINPGILVKGSFERLSEL